MNVIGQTPMVPQSSWVRVHVPNKKADLWLRVRSGLILSEALQANQGRCKLNNMVAATSVDHKWIAKLCHG